MSVIEHGRITTENAGSENFQRCPGNKSQSFPSWLLIPLSILWNVVKFSVFKNQYYLPFFNLHKTEFKALTLNFYDLFLKKNFHVYSENITLENDFA